MACNLFIDNSQKLLRYIKNDHDFIEKRIFELEGTYLSKNYMFIKIKEHNTKVLNLIDDINIIINEIKKYENNNINDDDKIILKDILTNLVDIYDDTSISCDFILSIQSGKKMKTKGGFDKVINDVVDSLKNFLLLGNNK